MTMRHIKSTRARRAVHLLLMGLGLLTASLASGNPRIAETEISIPAEAGRIEGTLTLPEGGAKVPVVLIIAGSGPTDRDGNSAGAPGKNNSLKLMAEGLAGVGVASVRYDKRGVGASRSAAPKESELRFETYVADAAAWLQALRGDARFNGVAILGHSEGSLIGMLVAKNHALDAYLSVSGPAPRASSALRVQLKGKLPSGLAEQSERILASLEEGRTVDEVPGPLFALYRPSVQPYLISWFHYEPASVFASLTVPSMVIQGDADVQVSVADANALHQARSDSKLLVIAGMNHVLKNVPAEPVRQAGSSADPSLPLSPTLVPAIAEFLLGAMKKSLTEK